MSHRLNTIMNRFDIFSLKMTSFRTQIVMRLMFSVNGGVGKEANKCYSLIAEKLAEKQDEPYPVMSWIRRKISFSMMKSIMCIRGGQSIKYEREKDNVEEFPSSSEARCNIT